MSSEAHQEFRENKLEYQVYLKKPNLTDVDYLLEASRLMTKTIQAKKELEK